MGTSVSHRSPKNNLNWRAAITTYTSEKATISRVISEVWRAIKYQQDSDFVKDLSSPTVISCLKIALKELSPENVSTEVGRTVALSGKSSIAVDIAKHAAVFSSLSSMDKINNFTKYLFSKAADYLVSRDISGYVGSTTKLRNISTTIEYKNNIQNEIKRIISDSPPPRDVENNVEIWNKYVNDITALLIGMEK